LRFWDARRESWPDTERTRRQRVDAYWQCACISDIEFEELAAKAKAECPILKALGAINVTLNAIYWPDTGTLTSASSRNRAAASGTHAGMAEFSKEREITFFAGMGLG
jgi:hypothetical protein